jgi:hypothetical protein
MSKQEVNFASRVMELAKEMGVAFQLKTTAVTIDCSYADIEEKVVEETKVDNRLPYEKPSIVLMTAEEVKEIRPFEEEAKEWINGVAERNEARKAEEEKEALHRRYVERALKSAETKRKKKEVTAQAINQETNKVKKIAKSAKTCKTDGCDKTVFAKGFCNKHFRENRYEKDIKEA